jgi:hypothetical protein
MKAPKKYGNVYVAVDALVFFWVGFVVVSIGVFLELCYYAGNAKAWLKEINPKE